MKSMTVCWSITPSLNQLYGMSLTFCVIISSVQQSYSSAQRSHTLSTQYVCSLFEGLIGSRIPESSSKREIASCNFFHCQLHRQSPMPPNEVQQLNSKIIGLIVTYQIVILERSRNRRMSAYAFENQKYHKLYINGKWVDPLKGGTFSTINPATGIHDNLFKLWM